MTVTVGIDIGSGVVKTALFDNSGGEARWLARRRQASRARPRTPHMR